MKHDTRSTMFGLAAHADLYHRLTYRMFGPLHRRIVADVTSPTTCALTGPRVAHGSGSSP